MSEMSLNIALDNTSLQVLLSCSLRLVRQRESFTAAIQ